MVEQEIVPGGFGFAEVAFFHRASRTPMAAFQSLLGLTTQHQPTTHKMLYAAEPTG